MSVFACFSEAVARDRVFFTARRCPLNNDSHICKRDRLYLVVLKRFVYSKPVAISFKKVGPSSPDIRRIVRSDSRSPLKKNKKEMASVSEAGV